MAGDRSTFEAKTLSVGFRPLPQTTRKGRTSREPAPAPRCWGCVRSARPGNGAKEAGKASDLDSPAIGEARRHLVEHPLHRELDVTLGEMRLLERNALDQLRSRHRAIVPLFEGPPRGDRVVDR